MKLLKTSNKKSLVLRRLVTDFQWQASGKHQMSVIQEDAHH